MQRRLHPYPRGVQVEHRRFVRQAVLWVAEVGKEVVEQFVARLRRRILRELEEAKAREPSK